jgi:hypothetical protein
LDLGVFEDNVILEGPEFDPASLEALTDLRIAGKGVRLEVAVRQNAVHTQLQGQIWDDVDGIPLSDEKVGARCAKLRSQFFQRLVNERHAAIITVGERVENNPVEHEDDRDLLKPLRCGGEGRVILQS